MADDGHDSGTKRLVVALVRGVHGLRGAVRVEVLTDRPEARFVPGAVLYPEGGDAPLTVATAEPVQDGPGWRLRFAEVASRDQADSLRGIYLETEVRPGVELARGEVYWHEVIGVPVRDLDGADLGVVKDVYRVAGTEVYVVGGGRFGTFDLPAVRAFIRIFAPRRGEIVIDAAALDLSPPKARPTGPDRPRAPRRSSRKPRTDAPSSTAPSPTVASPTSAEDPQGRDAAAGTDPATDVGA